MPTGLTFLERPGIHPHGDETKDRCFVSEAAGLVRNKTSFARYHLVRDILGMEPAEEKGK